MIKFLFCFNGKSTRKEWWMVTLATLAAEALLYLLVPACPWLLAACAAVLVPWLAVSSRRLESTGNRPEKGLAGFLVLLLPFMLLPLMDGMGREAAQPFLFVLAMLGGIVSVSYAVICGFCAGKA